MLRIPVKKKSRGFIYFLNASRSANESSGILTNTNCSRSEPLFKKIKLIEEFVQKYLKIKTLAQTTIKHYLVSHKMSFSKPSKKAVRYIVCRQYI